MAAGLLVMPMGLGMMLAMNCKRCGARATHGGNQQHFRVCLYDSSTSIHSNVKSVPCIG